MNSSRPGTPSSDVTDEAGAGESHQLAPATRRAPVIRHRKFHVSWYDANGEALRSEVILTGSAFEALRISAIPMTAEQKHRAAKIKVQEMESVHD